MKLITLAKQLDFESEYEYFDYCINSHVNGNFNQCKDLFNAMTKKDKKEFITYVKGCYDIYINKDVYTFYFNLL